MDRAQRLLGSLTKRDRVIEIGPSLRPLAPKRDGWNTLIVDHASQEELVAKYSGQDASQIEEVDYIWRGGSLADAVSEDEHGTFDAFIASHVIEHTTDIVTFLRAAETLVRPEGVIILALPDKRKCFDFYRHPSTTADALAAFAEKRERHDLRTHFEYSMRSVNKDGGLGWSINDRRQLKFNESFDQAHAATLISNCPDYVDAHNWVFVPSSFSLLIAELAAMDHIDLRIDEIAEDYEAEFFAWLRKGRDSLPPTELQQRRKELMDLIILELAEQSRQIGDHRSFKVRAETYDQEKSQEEEFIRKAFDIVLLAVVESTRRWGFSRKKFQKIIMEASRSIPASGPGTIQHTVLLEFARRVLSSK